MENRWILIIALAVLLCLPVPVAAYWNINAGGHPLINKYAVEYFENNILPNDPLLSGTSVRGEESWGYAWDESDGRQNSGPRNQISRSRSKTIESWIMDGGFSADEPEWTMALVHFYDPTNINEPWLTDPWWIMNRYTEFLARVKDPNLVVPDLSAVHWAFDYDSGSGYFMQDYSWNDGMRYYQNALASDLRTNYNYGQAWRAVGETMHLVSDMTIPAHVRNDGHPTFNEDPFEESVRAGEVTRFRDGQPLAINYDRGTVRDLMVRVATTVNQNFYSADTMPSRMGTGPDAVYLSDYALPTLEGKTPDADGYYYSPVAGALAREELSPVYSVGTGGTYLYRIDKKVLDDQRRVLIPTAIRASAEVLDRFLPRFEARLAIEKYLPEDPDDDQYVVYTSLKQVHSEPDTWAGYDLVVRNGAYLIETTPDGKKTETPLWLTPIWTTPPADPNFNNWVDLFKFEPGTRVQMKYDLGGYVIKSNEVLIPITTPTPTPPPTPPTTVTTPTTYETTVIATSQTTPGGYAPACGDGGYCQKCCIWVDQTDLRTGEQGYWAVRALCNCETGEDVDVSSYDTNPWSGLP